MYAYATVYEDMAMLFESAMLKYHYGIEMDIAFISNPSNPNSCEDYIVGWGSRNQIARDGVKQRVNFVLKSILPNSANWDNFTDNQIGTTKPLSSGVDWCSSIGSSTREARMLNKRSSIPYNDFRAPSFY